MTVDQVYEKFKTYKEHPNTIPDEVLFKTAAQEMIDGYEEKILNAFVAGAKWGYSFRSGEELSCFDTQKAYGYAMEWREK
jgi:hypothetical protein